MAGTSVQLERRAAQALDSLMAAIDGWKGDRTGQRLAGLAEQQGHLGRLPGGEWPALPQTYVACPEVRLNTRRGWPSTGPEPGEIDFIAPPSPMRGPLPDLPADHGPVWMGAALPGREGGHHRHYEPWHFRYVGQPHAALMAERDLTLKSISPSNT